MENNSNLTIIILAAGKGTRMKSDEPKALTLLKGKAFLIHILDTIKNFDPEIKPIIVVGYKKERIMEVLGGGYIYAEQKEQLGTGHAVMSAENNVNKNHKMVLIISADQPLISKETISEIIKKHTETKATVTIAVAPLPNFNEWRSQLINFGRIIRDENNKLKKIVEYKDANEAEKEITEVNPAVYAFDSEWLWKNINKLKNENTQKEYYLTGLIKIACDQNKKIETIPLSSTLEIMQPNSKEELEVLESLVV